ncbi:unnamed protein product [Penicillium discolor]
MSTGVSVEAPPRRRSRDGTLTLLLHLQDSKSPMCKNPCKIRNWKLPVRFTKMCNLRETWLGMSVARASTWRALYSSTQKKADGRSATKQRSPEGPPRANFKS